MTLVEVAIAMTLLALFIAGLFASLLQSRRLTEASIYQNAANTILQGYIEQMKNMEFEELSRNPIPTRLDADTLDPLSTSAAPVIAVDDVVFGTVPAGVVENVKVVDINNTPANVADDLTLRIWLWLEGLDSPAATSLAQSRVLGISAVYIWEHNDGAEVRRFKGNIRTIRSFVPTF
jgi:type II secretory pathway pseudopilin PulG